VAELGWLHSEAEEHKYNPKPGLHNYSNYNKQLTFPIPETQRR